VQSRAAGPVVSFSEREPKVADHDDDGLTLVEIVIAMFVLALVMIGMLPLLITGIQASAQNTTRATANQLVSERMERATNRGPSCAAIAALAGVTVQNDPRGVPIRVTTAVAACPAAGTAATVLVTATAVRTDTGVELATSSTLVFVR